MQLPNVDDIYPMSPMQQGMMFHTLYDKESSVYIGQLVCRLEGRLKVNLYRQAWQQVLDAHPVLRTQFVMKNMKEPLQIVRKHIELPWYMNDWRELNQEHQSNELEQLLLEDRRQGFNYTQAPLIRCYLNRITKHEYYFIMSHHHSLLDGWSLGLVLNEVLHRYNNLTQNRAIKIKKPRPYSDYIAWLNQQDMNHAEHFWSNELSSYTKSTPIPLSNRSVVQKLHNNNIAASCRKSLELSNILTTKLKNMARNQQVTINTLVQAAWSLLLSCYSGESEVLFGVTSSGRPVDLPGADKMIGLFISTLPFRVSIPSDISVSKWLKELQEQQVKIRQFEYASLAEIQRWSGVPHNESLFDTILVFENHPLSGLPSNNNDLSISEVRGIEKPHYTISVAIALSDNLSFDVTYNDSRISSTKIDIILQRLKYILQALDTHQQGSLTDIPWLSDNETQRIVRQWNATTTKFPTFHGLHRQFEEQADSTPDAVAMICDEQRLTYRELNDLANRLANYLKNHNVNPGHRVGLCMERCAILLPSLLAILKSGAVYVPIEPSMPEKRLHHIIKDSQITLIMAQEKYSTMLDSFQVNKIYADMACIDGEETNNLPLQTTPDDSIYIIYTSGSTGLPKGAVNTLAGIHNQLQWMKDTFAVSADDRILHKTSINFDPSVWELLLPIISGAAVVIATPEGHTDPTYIHRIITSENITMIYMVPFMLESFLSVDSSFSSPSLRTMICGGEALSSSLIDAFYERFTQCNLYNSYGPTETSIGVSHWPCPRRRNVDTVSIGKPIANTQLYIVDKQMRLLPEGAPGELCIAGVNVGKGYFNSPKETARKFITDPFTTDKRSLLYKSGDRASYMPNGDIEFLGRMDSQIKIRGVRIEPKEIESILLQHRLVQNVVVRLYNMDDRNAILVAYLVSNAPVEKNKLVEFLKKYLPASMIPVAFVELERFPLTINGKLDEKALPQPNVGNIQTSENHVQPRDFIDLQMTRIWEEVLKIKPIGITDNYFELGGHSLSAIYLLSEIEKQFNKKFPLSVLFDNGTIEHLSNLVREDKGFLPQSVLVDIQPKGINPPFYCVHPAGGNVLCYTDLARCLGDDQPFFGLQDPGLLKQNASMHSIEEMASHYLNKIMSQQTHGPYYLGGWSMGGLVAYEMAQQLIEQGQVVALLALLDVASPRSGTIIPTADKAVAMTSVISEIGRAFKKEINICTDILTSLSKNKLIEHIYQVFQDAGESISKQEIVSIFEYAQRYASVNEANIQASNNYRIRPYPGKITLIRAKEIDKDFLIANPDFNDQLLGWEHLSPYPVELYQVSGHHDVMVYDPNASELADTLIQCIKNASTSSGITKSTNSHSDVNQHS